MREIFNAIAAAGDALPFSSAMAPETFYSHWFGAHRAYVAEDGAGIIGMYKVGANYPDRGSHIGSATYLVAPAAQGKGVGRALVTHSIAQALEDGFLAMQFNYVVSTNAAAVTLYEKLGFTIAGTLPRAFLHAALGLVDAYVMYKPLR
ncbi:hypothetical protein GCM10027277_40050 [Pseudoduganella ginsengisoli]